MMVNSICVAVPVFDLDGQMTGTLHACPDARATEYSIYQAKNRRIDSAAWERKGDEVQASIHRNIETMRDLLLAGF